MRVISLDIDRLTRADLCSLLSKTLTSKTASKLSIAKINSEFIHRAWADGSYAGLINSLDLRIADGRGVLWSARYLSLPVSKFRPLRLVQALWQIIYSGALVVFYPKFIKKPIPEVFPGVEVFYLMIEQAIRLETEVFILGAPQEIVSQAVLNLKKQYPKLKLAGYLNGYDFQKDSSIKPVEIINKTKAKLLFVAMGSPRQEQWIKDNLSKLKNVRVAVGEGGTLTRIAKPNQKAPKLVNRIGLEWLWRTIFNASETSSRNRLQRFWRSVPVFIYLNFKWKVRDGYIKT